MLGMGYFVSTLRNKTTNQRPTFIAVYTRYGILYLSFRMGTSAAYNDEQRRVPLLIKNQLPNSTAYVNLIGLTAGGGGSGESRYLDLAVNSRTLCL